MTEAILDAKERIKSLDMSMIARKMIRLGWKADDIELAIHQYKNLLLIWKKYPDEGPLPPSEDIDEVWHNHILDTKKYHQDCLDIFGKYLHHYPYFGIDDKTTQKDLDVAFEKTKSLYFKEFGEELTTVRINFKRVLKLLIKKINRRAL